MMMSLLQKKVKMVNAFLRIFVLLGYLALCCHSRPMGGIFHDVIYSTNTSTEVKFNGTCHVMGLYHGNTISVKVNISAISGTAISEKNPANLTIGVKVFRLMCANFLDMSMAGLSNSPCGRREGMDTYLKQGYLYLYATASQNMILDGNNGVFKFEPDSLQLVAPPTTPPTTAKADTSADDEKAAAEKAAAEKAAAEKAAAEKAVAEKAAAEKAAAENSAAAEKAAAEKAAAEKAAAEKAAAEKAAAEKAAAEKAAAEKTVAEKAAAENSAAETSAAATKKAAAEKAAAEKAAAEKAAAEKAAAEKAAAEKSAAEKAAAEKAAAEKAAAEKSAAEKAAAEKTAEKAAAEKAAAEKADAEKAAAEKAAAEKTAAVTSAAAEKTSKRETNTITSNSDHEQDDPLGSMVNDTTEGFAGMYLLQVYVEKQGQAIVTNVDIKMHNSHGYLSAVDYPALVFYGIMTTVYAVFGIVWIVLMMCSFRDLVRLQFWILAVIILGFLEKTFFVAEYSATNLGHDTYGSYVVAEFVSAVKRGLSRMLLIIVAMGFGTVRPRLGDSLFKVVAAGVAYFSLALVDGIMRARSNTFHTNDTSSVITLALLLLTDTIIFYWIFNAIVDTRRTLRLRKNFTKLAMYNHFAYTLIFAVLATIAFTIWVFVSLEYPTGLCLTDWREVWVRDCFWHVLFAFILLVVMVIWRPSTNKNRFAYSLVADEEEVVFEQGANKNFDTVKLRSVNKSEPRPPVSSQAEDDLRWVEENLPTTVIDKALPLIQDSDEEVMTTKFEISKMN